MGERRDLIHDEHFTCPWGPGRVWALVDLYREKSGLRPFCVDFPSPRKGKVSNDRGLISSNTMFKSN